MSLTIASYLSARDYVTTLTIGNTRIRDVITISPKGNIYTIQVKTTFNKNPRWVMDERKTDRSIKNLFYAFVRLNKNDPKKLPDFWLIPSSIVADYVHKAYNSYLKAMRRDGTPHEKNKNRVFRIKKDRYTPKKYENKSWSSYYLDNSLTQLK